MAKVLIGLVLFALLLAGGVLYLASQADNAAPELETIRTEAQNVGPY